MRLEVGLSDGVGNVVARACCHTAKRGLDPIPPPGGGTCDWSWVERWGRQRGCPACCHTAKRGLDPMPPPGGGTCDWSWVERWGRQRGCPSLLPHCQAGFGSNAASRRRHMRLEVGLSDGVGNVVAPVCQSIRLKMIFMNLLSELWHGFQKLHVSRKHEMQPEVGRNCSRPAAAHASARWHCLGRGRK